MWLDVLDIVFVSRIRSEFFSRVYFAHCAIRSRVIRCIEKCAWHAIRQGATNFWQGDKMSPLVVRSCFHEIAQRGYVIVVVVFTDGQTRYLPPKENCSGPPATSYRPMQLCVREVGVEQNCDTHTYTRARTRMYMYAFSNNRLCAHCVESTPVNLPSAKA